MRPPRNASDKERRAVERAVGRAVEGAPVSGMGPTPGTGHRSGMDDCIRMEPMLGLLVGNDTTAEEAEEVRKHTASCGRCAAEHARLVWARRALQREVSAQSLPRAVSGQANPEPDDAFFATMQREILAKVDRGVPRRSMRPWFMPLGLAAAALLIFSLDRPQQAPSLVQTDPSRGPTLPQASPAVSSGATAAGALAAGRSRLGVMGSGGIGSTAPQTARAAAWDVHLQDVSRRMGDARIRAARIQSNPVGRTLGGRCAEFQGLQGMEQLEAGLAIPVPKASSGASGRRAGSALPDTTDSTPGQRGDLQRGDLQCGGRPMGEAGAEEAAASSPEGVPPQNASKQGSAHQGGDVELDPNWVWVGLPAGPRREAGAADPKPEGCGTPPAPPEGRETSGWPLEFVDPATWDGGPEDVEPTELPGSTNGGCGGGGASGLVPPAGEIPNRGASADGPATHHGVVVGDDAAFLAGLPCPERRGRNWVLRPGLGCCGLGLFRAGVPGAKGTR